MACPVMPRGTARARWRAGAALIAALPGACAHYAPAPLGDGAAVLAAPDAAILSQAAQAIDRPYLKPQPIELDQPLNANAIAVIAVLRNPDLRAQRTKLGVATAQAFAARLLPDPTAQGSVTPLVGGPDPVNPLGGQIALDLGQLRTARVTREGGRAAVEQVRLDLAWAEWSVAGQARLLAVRIAALELSAQIAADSATAAERLYSATARAAGRGDVAGAELDSRRQALTAATARARGAGGDLATARGELNRLLGLPPETGLRLAPPEAPPMPPDAATLTTQAIGRRLDLAALRAGYAAAEASVHKAVLEQFPNLQLALAAARDTVDNRTIGPTIGFTLPLWNRNRGGIAIAEATRAGLKAEYEARLFQTRAEISAAVAAIAALRRQRQELRAAMPKAEAFADAAARAAGRRDLPLTTAETARQSVRDQRLALIQLDQQIAEQTIAPELLSGGPSEGWWQ